MMLRHLLRSTLPIVLVVSIPIAGVLVGYVAGTHLSGAGRLVASPLQVEWRSLGFPEKKPIAILEADVDTIATLSANGEISYWRSNSGWREVEEMPSFSHSADSFDMPHGPPPGDVIVTHQAAAPGEAGTFTEYAILADGSVWIWKFTQPGLGLLVAFVYGLTGAVLGFLMGLILAWWVWRKIRRPDPGSRD